MNHRILSYILCFFGATLLLSSCYDKQIEEVKARVETITLTDAEKVVADMQATLNDLEDLKTKVKPAIDELDSAKVEIDKRISELRTELQSLQGAAADALEHELDNRRDQAKAIDGAIKELDVKKIDARIEAIKSVMREIEEKKYDERLAALEAAAESFATLKDLAGVQTSLDKANSAIESVKSSLSGLGNAIVEQVASSLEEYKERIITWVSESEALAELFSQYYTAAEMDAKLKAIDKTDSTQNTQIAALQKAADEVQGKIESYVTEAIEGAGGLNEFIAGQISALRGEIATLKTDIGKLIGDPEDLLTSAKETIVAAINEILDKFKSDTAYVNGVVGILKNDISCLEDADKAITGGADLSVTNLKILNDALVSLLETTGSKLDTNRLKTAVQNVQNAIVDCLTEGEVNAKLADYVTLDAAKAYALAKDFSDFDEKYKEFFGIGTTPAPANSVLGRIATLNGYVGSGQINWAEDLTEAVNKIYSGLLAAQKTDSEKIDSAKADAIARKLIAGLVKEIIGEGKDASDIKTLLQSFVTASETFAKQLGSAEFEGEDISSALKAVQDKLDDYAQTGHKHSYEDIEDFNDAIEAVVGKISDLNAELGASNLVDAINKLYALFDKYDSTGVTYNRTEANNILSSLQFVLAMAILKGEIAEGHETALSGFDSLNLSGLLESVNDIIKEKTGILDTRLKNNFFDVLGDLVTEEDLADYVLGEDFDKLKTLVGNDDEKGAALARLAALEAVNITIEKDNYTKWTDAVSAVNTLLKARIERLEAIWSTFDELSNRFTALETIAGDGFEQKSLTDSIQSIINRIGDIKGEKTVAQLISDLQNAETTLVNAVINGDEGQFKDLNLTKFDNAVKAIKNDLKIEGAEGVGLTAILTSISDRLGSIEALIGDGFSSDHTIADAIKELQNQINSLNDSFATDEELSNMKDDLMKELSAAKQALVDAIMGELAEGQEHHSLEEYNTLNLKTLKDRLDNITVNSQKSIETILSDLNNRLNNINTILNVTNVGMDTSIVQKVADLKKKVTSPSQMWDVLAGSIEGVIEGVFEAYIETRKLSDTTTVLCDAIKNLYSSLVGADELNTGSYSNVTDAVNYLYDCIIKWDFENAKKEEDLNTAIDNLRKLLLNADSLPDVSIKSVEIAISSMSKVIGTSSNPEKYDELFEAVAYIESLIGDIATGVRKTLNSLVYIPEYDDGKASVINGKAISMDFTVNATSVFYDQLCLNKYNIQGQLKGKSDKIDCEYSTSNGILTLTFDVSGKDLKDTDRLAVIVSNKNVNYPDDKYISPYVGLKNVEIDQYLVVNPADGTTLTFNVDKPDVAQYISVIGGKYSVEPKGCAKVSDDESGRIAVTINEGSSDGASGSVVITSKDDDSETYTYHVIARKYSIGIDIDANPIVLPDGYSKTYTYPIRNNFNYSGGFVLTGDQPDWMSAKIQGSAIVVSVWANNTTGLRETESELTVSTTDGLASFNFKVKQPMAEYTMSLGEKSSDFEDALQNGFYVAKWASQKTYWIRVNTSPEYSGKFIITGCPVWMKNVEVANGKLTFTLDNNKGNNDKYSEDITVATTTGTQVQFKVKQPKISFALNVAGIEGVTYDSSKNEIELPYSSRSEKEVMGRTYYRSSIAAAYEIPVNATNFESPSFIVSGTDEKCFSTQPNIKNSSTLCFTTKEGVEKSAWGGNITGEDVAFSVVTEDRSNEITIHAFDNGGPSLTFKVKVN